MIHILKELWGRIIIPEAVYIEVVTKGSGKPGASIIADACKDWIEVVTVKNRQEVSALQTVLDEGEAEVIALGQEIKADLLLLDNKEPRLFAKTVDLKVIGTVGIIRLAWQKGLIKSPLEELYRLKANGFWIDDSLIDIFRMH
ncbi:MAG: DUF3368 domain-containing protein [Nitrospirae bacterium]|nr:DUF3368 domain-containing protein [Nitrospirota bacterium]